MLMLGYDSCQNSHEGNHSQIAAQKNLDLICGGIHGWGTTFETKGLRNMSHWTWCLS